MLDFLAANLSTIIVGMAVLAVVAVVVTKMVRDKHKGISSCGCDCKECPSASSAKKLY